MKLWRLCIVLSFCSAASFAPAGQVRLTVDPSASSLEVTLCVQGVCDTDTSALNGSVVAALDNNSSPTQISLRNFDLRANDDYDFVLDYGFLVGVINAHARDLRIYHGAPGVTNPFVAITASQYTFVEVPFLMSGTAEYAGEGLLICSLIEGAGLPCSSNLDLSTLGSSTIPQAPGTIQINNGIATMDLTIDFSIPFDPANPDLGTISGHGIVRASGPISTGLVPPSSDWRFLDDGSDQGVAWRQPGFSDATWLLGPSQLGYGDGDEETIINGGPIANRIPTTYFRHAFDVPDASIYTNLALRVLRDDGVIVYLNDVEVFRDNLPNTDVNYLSVANTAVAGAAENVFFVAPPISPSLLVNGTNVLAVEIHQSGPESSDVSFDLQFIGNGIFTNAIPTVAITNPPNGTTLLTGTITLAADASDSDGLISKVEFFEGLNKIGEVSNPPYTLLWPSVPPGLYTLTARATDNGLAVAVSAPVILNVVRPPVSIVSTGAMWRFLDNGTAPAAAWHSNTFNDSTWRTGRGQFGYGDGDEATLVSYGPNPDLKYITTYFRHSFNVLSPALSLTLRLLRDDGAVVYLNGAEVHRNNMPTTGTITSTTLALTNAAPGDETTNYFVVSLNPSLILVGSNLLAVEVHQVSTNSSDLSFDAELIATLTNLPPTVVLTQPGSNALFHAGANIPFQCLPADADGTITKVEYFADGIKVAQSASPPFQATWTNASAGLYLITAKAIDDWGGGGFSVPVPINVGVFSLVQRGAQWRYLDNGSDQNTNWIKIGFADGSWKSGSAQLGYGDNDEATLISYGPESTNKFITTYFRRAWQVPDRSLITSLLVRLLRDDGAAVYLNEVEVFRSNLPDGPLNYQTRALNAVSGTDETAYYSTNVPTSLLRNGLNVIAVELHQVLPDSSDVSFDLQLLGAVSSFQPTLSIERSGSSITLRWPSAAVGYNLQFAPSLTPPVNWQPMGTPADDGAWKTSIVPLPGPTPAAFFRLRTP